MPGKIRKGDLIASVDVTINLPAGLLHYVDELLRTGLYGNTTEQALHWIIARAVSDRIDAGHLPLYEFDRMGNVTGIRRR